MATDPRQPDNQPQEPPAHSRRQRAKPTGRKANEKPVPQKNDYDKIDRAVDDYQRDHPIEVAKDPRNLREKLVRRVRARFHVKPGPRTDIRVVRAHNLKERGASASKVYSAMYPHYRQSDRYERLTLRKAADKKLARYERSLRARRQTRQ